MASDQSRISTNAAYQLLAQAAVSALNFIASPIIVHGLGMEAYGLLVLVGVTTNYFGFVELGLGRATIQNLARHRARGETSDFQEVLWTATAAYFALSLVGALGLVAIAPLLVKHVLVVSPGLVPEALWAFVLGAAGLVIALQRNVAQSVGTAMERFDLVSKVTLAIGALQAAANVGLVLLGAPLTGVMLGGLAVQTVALVVYWGVAWKLVPNLFPPRWSLEKLRSLVRFGGYVTVSQVVAPLLENVEKMFIGALAAVDQLPYYSVSYSGAWALTVVPTSLGSVIYPAMVRLLSQGDHAGVRETVKRATRYVFVLLVGPVVLLVIYAREILTAWMGASFAAGASGCLRILTFAMLVSVVAWPSYHLLHAAGRADLTARFHLLELVLHVPTSLVFIYYGGVVGAAVAWLIRVVIDSGLLFRAAARIAGMPVRFVIESLGRGTVAALALLPVALVGRGFLEGSSRVQTALILCSIGLGYVPLVAWLGLGREDRSAALSVIRALLTGSKGETPVER